MDTQELSWGYEFYRSNGIYENKAYEIQFNNRIFNIDE